MTIFLACTLSKPKSIRVNDCHKPAHAHVFHSYVHSTTLYSSVTTVALFFVHSICTKDACFSFALWCTISIINANGFCSGTVCNMHVEQWKTGIWFHCSFCLVIFLPSKCFYSPGCLRIHAVAVSFFCACLGQMLIKLAARTSCHGLTCSGEIMLFGPDSQVALSQLWNGLVANWLPQTLMGADLDKFSCRFIGTPFHFKNI